jgi:hypothetical protein
MFNFQKQTLPDLHEETLTFDKLLSIWWAIIWRAFLLSLILGLVLGFIGGFIVAMLGRSDLGAAVGGVLGWLGGFPSSLWALKKALMKNYTGYRIGIIKQTL